MSGLPARLLAVDSAGAVGLEPLDAARRIAAALAAAPSALLLRPSPRAQALRAALPADVPVVAVLPDMPQLLRDAAERGLPRAALSRLAPGGIGAWWRLGLTTLRHLPDIARQDFRGLVPALLELERASLGAAALRGVALAAPLTDLLLAAGHRDCLAHVVAFVRRQVGAPAGFETLNLGHLLPRLAAWGVAPDFVIGPMNARGWRMKPSPAAVLAALRESRVPVWASEVSAGGTLAAAEAETWARAHGAAGVVLSLADLPVAVGG